MARVERSWSRHPLSSAAPVVPGRYAYWREPRVAGGSEDAFAGVDMNVRGPDQTNLAERADHAEVGSACR
jgi:hypothetical protein